VRAGRITAITSPRPGGGVGGSDASPLARAISRNSTAAGIMTSTADALVAGFTGGSRWCRAHVEGGLFQIESVDHAPLARQPAVRDRDAGGCARRRTEGRRLPATVCAAWWNPGRDRAVLAIAVALGLTPSSASMADGPPVGAR